MTYNLCFECGKPAQTNHHVVPKSKGGTKTIPLCYNCHGKVHGKDFVKMHSLSKDVVNKMREDGFYVGGKREYGYDIVEGKLIENKTEQEVIEKIKEWRASGAKKIDVLRRLNNAGIKGATGGVWKYESLRKLIKRLERVKNDKRMD